MKRRLPCANQFDTVGLGQDMTEYDNFHFPVIFTMNSCVRMCACQCNNILYQ